MENNTSRGGFAFPYETVVKGERSAKVVAIRIALIVFYTLWTLGNVAAVLLHHELLGLILIVLPLTLWLLIRLTWRRTFAEYEYSIFGGTITVSRILGGKTRRVLAEVGIRDLALIAPYDDEHIAPIANFGAKHKSFAVSSLNAPTIYALLWKEDDEKYLLCIEPDEKTLELLRYHNHSAFRG